MIFIALTFIAAFAIEGLGTLVSVIGLSALFGANPIIIALAISLDMGKLVVVSLLYTYWKKLGAIMKTYALLASIVTMVITSAGAAGYLSAEFQKAIIGTQEGSLKVNVLKEEQARLQKRKEQIDQQIASLPEKFSAAQRIRMINQFKDEQKQVTARLTEIDKELPTIQIQQINVEAKAGPILYVAKAFDVPVEVAVKYVILLIIFVFDPLAVFLIIAGNFLLHQRRLHKETKVEDADLFEEKQPKQIVRDMTPPAPMYEVLVPSKPLPVEEDKNDVMSSREPITEAPAEAPTSVEPEPTNRDTITKSTLGLVPADPGTVVDASAHEVGYKTGVYRTGGPT